MTHLTREQIAENMFPINESEWSNKDFGVMLHVKRNIELRVMLTDFIKERDQVVWDAACKEMKDQNELDLSIAMNTSQSDIDTEKWVKIIKDGQTPPFKIEGE